ncbi:molecular chaperone [Serratia fonticola]|uniref:fimbrial biogenesis chaperone n=1 Tax=Serratia fonticola TaxID=47917 RepID=UPI001574F13F|nr:molecular chaperone [Serratia fonticola]NTY86743.1 molecular chaperone [Serratia fonticola]NTZ12535.1 molecular chaperone [Serratia fonticola]
MKFYQKLGVIVSLSIVLAQPALAGINLGATRIIFSGIDSSQSIDINNRSYNQPYLINVGISDSLSGKSTSSAFMPAPALFRIDADSSNKVRILKKSNSLPQDRESVFYLNVMAIPTGKAVQDNNDNKFAGTLQVATGNTIKLFYRPDNLAITQKEAMGKLQFSRQGGSVKVANPTPYYISMKTLMIDGKKVKLDVIKGTSMIAPFASNVYSVTAGQGKAEWAAINDFGGVETFRGTVH